VTGNDDKENRAHLVALRRELAKHLVRVGLKAPAPDAPAEVWNAFLTDARDADGGSELVAILRLLSEAIGEFDRPISLSPPPGAFVRGPRGELRRLSRTDAKHETQ
jgi:hypothetical protein